MGDYIKRADALNGINDVIGKERHWAHMVTLTHARAVIEELPSVDVVPVVHGKWVLITPHPSILYNHYRCSECGEMKYNKSLFCPNCGAKMDSSETDEPEINPCRGCSDYDGNGRCLSDGGCAGTGENKDG